MKYHLVSAIITTHNRSVLLKRAIESVLSQTYTDIECIVVDDKSTDNTREVCAFYPSVQYIYIPPEESKGGNYARNKGIEAAKGEYIAFLDDDDAWLPTKIEKQLNVAMISECEMVYCGWRVETINENGDISYKDELPRVDGRGDYSKRIFERIPATTSELFIKREIIDKIGRFDEDLGFWQEYELLIRLSQITIFDYVNEALIIYRRDINDSQRLTNKYEGWKDAVYYIKRKHQSLIKKLSFIQRLRFMIYIYNEDLYRCGNRNRLFFRMKLLFMRSVSRMFRVCNY